MANLTPTNTALLAAFEACTDHNSYWHTFRAVESRLNYLYNNGMFDDHAALQPEFTRINRAVRGRIEALALRPSQSSNTSQKAA